MEYQYGVETQDIDLTSVEKHSTYNIKALL